MTESSTDIEILAAHKELAEALQEVSAATQVQYRAENATDCAKERVNAARREIERIANGVPRWQPDAALVALMAPAS